MWHTKHRSQRVHRWPWGVVMLSAVLGMMVALYSQHVMQLEPCPLCVFQRVALIATGLCALLGWALPQRGWGYRIMASLMLCASLSGAGIAAWHVRLQHLPPEHVPACGPGLEFWLETLPWRQVLDRVFRGSGECAQIDWSFLGFSMPAWTLVLFLSLSALSVWQLWSSSTRRQ